MTEQTPEAKVYRKQLQTGESIYGRWYFNWQHKGRVVDMVLRKAGKWNLFNTPDSSRVLIVQADEVRIEGPSQLIREGTAGFLQAEGWAKLIQVLGGGNVKVFF